MEKAKYLVTVAKKKPVVRFLDNVAWKEHMAFFQIGSKLVIQAKNAISHSDF